MLDLHFYFTFFFSLPETFESALRREKFAIVIILTLMTMPFLFPSLSLSFDLMLCEKSTRFLFGIAFLSDVCKKSKTNWISRTGNSVYHCYNNFTDAACATQSKFSVRLYCYQWNILHRSKHFNFHLLPEQSNELWREKKCANKISVTTSIYSLSLKQTRKMN